MIPLELCDATRSGPQIGGHVNFEITIGDVVKGRDDDGLVYVFRYVMQYLPPTWHSQKNVLPPI